MYNIGAPYKIIGRVIDKVTVTKYVIEDLISHDIQIIDKSTVDQLAINKQIYNCKAQLYNNKVNLRGIGCKLSQLPRYNEDGTPYVNTNELKQPSYRIIARVKYGKYVKQYDLMNKQNGEVSRLDTEEIIELAKKGDVENVFVQKSNNKYILRSKKGFNINNVRTIFYGGG